MSFDLALTSDLFITHLLYFKVFSDLLIFTSLFIVFHLILSPYCSPF